MDDDEFEEELKKANEEMLREVSPYFCEKLLMISNKFIYLFFTYLSNHFSSDTSRIKSYLS